MSKAATHCGFSKRQILKFSDTVLSSRRAKASKWFQHQTLLHLSIFLILKYVLRKPFPTQKGARFPHDIEERPGGFQGVEIRCRPLGIGERSERKGERPALAAVMIPIRGNGCVDIQIAVILERDPLDCQLFRLPYPFVRRHVDNRRQVRLQLSESVCERFGR